MSYCKQQRELSYIRKAEWIKKKRKKRQKAINK